MIWEDILTCIYYVMYTLYVYYYKISLIWLSPHNLLEEKIQVTTLSGKYHSWRIHSFTLFRGSGLKITLHPTVSQYIVYQYMSLVQLFFFFNYIYMLKNNTRFHFHHFFSRVGEEGRERHRPNTTHHIQAKPSPFGPQHSPARLPFLHLGMESRGRTDPYSLCPTHNLYLNSHSSPLKEL